MGAEGSVGSDSSLDGSVGASAKTSHTKNKKGKIAGLIFILVIAVAGAVFLYTNNHIEKNQNHGGVLVCEANTLKDVMNAIDRGDEDKGLKAVSKITKNQYWERDASCAYVVMRYYDSMGIAPTIEEIDRFDKAYDASVGLHPALGVSAEEVESFRQRMRHAADAAAERRSEASDELCDDVGCELVDNIDLEHDDDGRN